MPLFRVRTLLSILGKPSCLNHITEADSSFTCPHFTKWRDESWELVGKPPGKMFEEIEFRVEIQPQPHLGPV